MQLSKTTKRVIKALMFAAIFLGLILVFDASFELDESSTENMLSRYSHTSDIDTIFVGNSAGEMMDAKKYSEVTGTHAFNMCTPSQGLYISLRNIKLACSHHKIKNTILLMTFDTASADSYDGIDHLYNRVVNSSSPMYKRIINEIQYNTDKSVSLGVLDTERSINIWIPWEEEHINGLGNITGNIRRRWKRLIEHKPLGYDIAYDLNTIVYERQPGDLTADDRQLLSADIDTMHDLDIPQDMLSDDKLTLLAEMCSYCRDNDITFTVVVTPHRTDYYDRYGSYRTDIEKVSVYLDDFISKRGFIYYNTEDDPQLHDILPDEYFYDWEHVSKQYKEISTDYLTDVIIKTKE